MTSCARECPRLDGAPNFREFGGQVTADGRLVRRGLLYRSERLSLLSDMDLERLRALDIGIICDLRGQNERRSHPSRWPQGRDPERLELGIYTDLRAGNETLQRLIAEDPSQRGAQRMMVESYRMLPTAVAPGLRLLFERLVARDVPVLIHCTAGKDRTGFVCACIQRALGVSYEDILRDYLLSAERLDLKALAPATAEILHNLFGLRLSDDTLAAVNGVAPAYLDAAFAAASERCGSFDAYMESAGLDAQGLQRLQARLLE